MDTYWTRNPNYAHATCIIPCFIFALITGAVFVLFALVFDSVKENRRWSLAAWGCPIVLTWTALSYVFAEYLVYLGIPLLPASCEASMVVENESGIPCEFKRFRVWATGLVHGDTSLSDLEPDWYGTPFMLSLIWAMAFVATCKCTMDHRQKWASEDADGSMHEMKPEGCV